MSASIRPATAGDGAQILDLIRRTPQHGLLTLNFERDPDFFLGARVSCEDPDVWVAEDDDAPGRIVAVINIGWRTVYVDGVPRRVRYGHDLRIDPAFRGGMLLHRIFRRLKKELAPGEWMQTVILDGNDVSLSTVGSGRAGMPTYYPDGTIETHLLFTAGRRHLRVADDLQVRRATAGDLAAMQAFLDREGAQRRYFPRLDLERLHAGDPYYAGLVPENFLLAFDGDVLAGMLGDWDQKAFKRTRVIDYPGPLRWVRHGYNAVSAIAGGMHLPAAGECFRYRSLHTVCVRQDDPRVFRALLDRALADNRDCDALVCGFFAGDPLATALQHYRRRTMRSLHFLVCYDGDPRPGPGTARAPYIDVARL